MTGGIAKFYASLLGIAEHFGWTNQCLKFIEEVCEALIELVHCFFSSPIHRRKRLIEELADVYVVLLQLPILLDQKYDKPQFIFHEGKLLTHQELFWEMVEFKIRRTEGRIESGYYEKQKEQE